MPSAADALKTVALRLLPDSALVPLKRWRYLRTVRGFWSPEATVLKAVLRPGDRALDVGAYAGWYTRVLAEAVGPTGHVYSLEPVPQTFSLLGFCVRRLGLDNVTLLNVAASDRIGAAVMRVPRYQSGGENFHQASLVPISGPADDLRSVTVSLSTLDSLNALRGVPIAAIKCDVEGHELAVVNGARRLIERWKPALCLEVSTDPDQAGSDAHTLFAYLPKVGYRAFRVVGSRLVPRSPGDRAVNYFFLTPPHLERTRGTDVLVD